jgi:hypothetical protein
MLAAPPQDLFRSDDKEGIEEFFREKTMSRTSLCLTLAAVLALPCPALALDSGDTDFIPTQDRKFERGAVLSIRPPHNANYNGLDVEASLARRQDHGLVLRDGKGGIIVLPGKSAYDANAVLLEARELKLKMRELADQLIAGLDKSLKGQIVLPTSFVPQDDFSRSSAFGRYAVEQLYYEFNQRGLPTREYRLGERLVVRDDGEFILTREAASSPLNNATLYVAGTYYTDGLIILVNARLLRAGGEILRTGQLIMNVTPMAKRMLANSGRKLQEGGIDVRDFNTEARPPETVTAFDQGMDIH